MKARLTLKVRAGVGKTGFTGKLGAAWKLQIAAPPVDGKANEAIIRFLAELTGAKTHAVRILGGNTASTKIVEIDEGRGQMPLSALFSNRMDLQRIQEALQRENLDGWLFFDHHARDHWRTVYSDCRSPDP